MSNRSIGISVYVSNFKKQKIFLKKFNGKETSVFTSLHITEEMTDSYIEDVEEMCDWFHQKDFWLIADV
ncbi:MAG: MupG family TIM beta-alpha barrel fold protein, partial [Atopostipes sp.]|nr:MupG family TIM beta-alpha barrel fold protein [Atopostipes sp.]